MGKKDMSFDEKYKLVEEGKIDKKTGKYTSMDNMRQVEHGYKPGESNAQFKTRKAAADLAKLTAKNTRIGKYATAVAGAGLAAITYLKSKMKKNEEANEAEGKMGGGMMKKYSKGESVKLSPKQMKIARMAPPPNKITGDDFKAMKANVGKSVKGYGQARKSGMGLEDENISLGKGSDYIKDLL